jgi:acyl-CoA synthetase (NDP forming)
LFEPTTVAVVGVSREPRGIGRAVIRNLLQHFVGTVLAVGRPGLQVPGVRCVAAVSDLPAVDLAIVTVPASELEAVVGTLSERGVRACVLITSALGATPDENKRLDARLAEVTWESGMRIVGPNCFGVISNLRGTRLNATFGLGETSYGPVAIGSQSGGVGIELLQAARTRSTGIACFVSLGNKADVSCNDLLAAWAEDPQVLAAGLYLESFQDPHTFVRMASTFARHKPLLVVFGGTSTAGHLAGESHTAASATPARARMALFRAAGVIEVDGSDALVDTAALLTEQPLPRGNRVGIVGNAGGLGILAADAAHQAGLVVPELASATREALRRAAPGAATTSNPVDLGAAASPGDYQRVLECLVRDAQLDAVLVLTAVTAVTDLDGVSAAVDWVASGRHEMPVLTVFSGEAQPTVTAASTSFRSPGDAVRALRHAVAYAEWRREATNPEEESGPGRNLPPAAEEEGWLSTQEAADLVTGCGGRTPLSRVVRSITEAVSGAEQLGYPVVLKASRPDIVHKTDRRLVRTDLPDDRAVTAAADDLFATLGEDEPLLLQQQVSGPEIAIGLTRDPRFGPLVMLASGGIMLDLWQDQVFLMPPLRRNDVRDALRSLHTWPLLNGFRGATPVDPEALIDLILSVGRLAESDPALAELDLNPVVCTAAGPVCVDVKARRSGSCGQEVLGPVRV